MAATPYFCLPHAFTMHTNQLHTEERGVYRVLVGRNRREGDHWGDLGIDGWIILGRISWRWDVGMWTGLSWPRIGTGAGHL